MASGLGFVVVNFRIRVGQGKYDGVGIHPLDQLRREGPLHRQPYEQVRTVHCFFQGACGRVAGQGLLIRIHPGRSSLIDHSTGIHHDQVGRFDSQLDIQLAAGDAGRSGPVDDDLQILYAPIRDR
jgi:hypothetical protein